MKFIATIWAMALTTIASAQVVSPNGKVEWREKGKGFAVVYHDGNNECEVLDITEIGILTKDGGGKELALLSIVHRRMTRLSNSLSIGYLVADKSCAILPRT